MFNMTLYCFKKVLGGQVLPGKGKSYLTTQAGRDWSPWRTRGKGVMSFALYLYPVKDLTTFVSFCWWRFCFFKELDGKVPFPQSHWESFTVYLQEKQLHKDFSDLMDLPAHALQGGSCVFSDQVESLTLLKSSFVIRQWPGWILPRSWGCSSIGRGLDP